MYAILIYANYLYAKYGGNMINEKLTEKQESIYNYIVSYSKEFGFPPTREEIARHFNLKQKASIIHQLQALEKKGYIKMLKKVARGIEILNQVTQGIPIVGEIAAGSGLLAEENVIGKWDPAKNGEIPKQAFALLVRGESMIEAGILEGDIVFIDPTIKPKNGDMGAVLIDGEATIKYILYNPDTVTLRPANKFLTDKIIPTNYSALNIIGPVIAMWRQLKNRK
jgi:repressor LexA